MNIRTLIFDWDGTIHKTSHLYGCAVRKAYEWLVAEGHAEFREISDEETNRFLGMNAADMWNEFMPDLPSNIKKQGELIVGRQMDDSISTGHAVLYDGALEVFEYLKSKGYELVILSNCRHNYLLEHRNYFNLDRWFSGYYAAQDYDFISKEEIYKIIIENHPGEYAMIGDRASDIAVGRCHNIFSVGCLYGYGAMGELKDASVCIEEIMELKNIF